MVPGRPRRPAYVGTFPMVVVSHGTATATAGTTSSRAPGLLRLRGHCRTTTNNVPASTPPPCQPSVDRQADRRGRIRSAAECSTATSIRTASPGSATAAAARASRAPSTAWSTRATLRSTSASRHRRHLGHRALRSARPGLVGPARRQLQPALRRGDATWTAVPRGQRAGLHELRAQHGRRSSTYVHGRGPQRLQLLRRRGLTALRHRDRAPAAQPGQKAHYLALVKHTSRATSPHGLPVAPAGSLGHRRGRHHHLRQRLPRCRRERCCADDRGLPDRARPGRQQPAARRWT